MLNIFAWLFYVIYGAFMRSLINTINYFTLLHLMVFFPQILSARAIGGGSGEVSVLSIIVLFFLLIGMPLAISLGLRFYTKNNLHSYFGTFASLLFIYYSTDFFVDLPVTDANMTAIFILLLSMLGSLLAQLIYYFLLPKQEG